MDLDEAKKAKLLVRCVINNNPKQAPAYIGAARLEEFSGRLEEAILLIEKGCEECPDNDQLLLESHRIDNIARKRAKNEEYIWIKSLKKLWLTDVKKNHLAGNLPMARKILHGACDLVPEAEDLWLAAFQLEIDNHEPERARAILAKAREKGKCVTERVWLKSAIVERELGDTDGEREVLDDGLRRFPSFFKLWLMLGQLEERIGDLEEAKWVYESGLTPCPKSVPLWFSLADVAEKTDGFSERREILAESVTIYSKSPELWLAAIRAEIKLGNKEEADTLMAKAFKKCPYSGILWAASIEMAPRRQRKAKIKEARDKSINDGHVFAAIGKLYWEDGKVEKARKRLVKAVTIAPYIGDFWALYYKFELEHGTDESQKYVLKRCVAAGPKHGEKWQMVSKALVNSRQPTEAILEKVVLALGE